MKTHFIKYFSDVVKRTAKLSTCASKQVGALLVKDNRILAISYNGVPSGKAHCEVRFGKVTGANREEHHIWSLKNELHAEQNLIAFCARNNIKTEGAILFITESPCISCAKLVVAAGIEHVCYVNRYDKDEGGMEFLHSCDVKTTQII